ncbi:MAG: hypothetical protein L6R39_006634 [Caloplaca ligustica]|nr:MAG: hypothetical protein L6R39_006634 [Caloplaca ligustica]
MAARKESSDDDGSPLTSVDDDAISLTSTVKSNHSENKRYEIEAIRWEAEDSEGTTRYLVKWKGYGEFRDTWEPVEQFDDEQTILDWRDRKMRIARGLVQPFDMDAWIRECKRHGAETKRRKRLRWQKKVELGLPAGPEAPSSEDPSGDEYREDSSEGQDSIRQPSPPSPVWTAKEESTLLEGLSRLRKTDWKLYFTWYGPQGIINKNLKNRTEDGLQRKAVALEKAFKESGRDFPIQIQLDKADRSTSSREDKSLATAQGPQHKLGARGVASAKRKKDGGDPCRDKPGDLSQFQAKAINGSEKPNTGTSERGPSTSELKSAPATPKAPPGTSSTANQTSASPLLTRLPDPPLSTAERRPPQLGAVGAGPARTGGHVPQARRGSAINVMKNWGTEDTKRRKSRYEKLDVQEAQGKPLAVFKKLSTRRQFEKATRYEHTPDVNSLTFVNTKNGKVLADPPPSVARKVTQKTPFQLLQEQLDENQSGPLSGPQAASKPILQRAATTGMGISESNVPPADRQPSEQLDVPDLGLEIDEPAPPVRRASLPLMPATQGTSQIGPTLKAPMAAMGSGPDITKGGTAAPPLNATPSEVRPPQRRDSLTKEPEAASEAALDNQALRRRQSDTALIRPSDPANPTSHGIQPREAETKPTPVNPASMKRGALGPPPSWIHPPADGYTLFPLTKVPRPAPVDTYLRETDVIAEILAGPEGHSTSQVIFRGLADTQLKRVFLTIREPPRRMHVWCRTMCTAGEFVTAFHVSGLLKFECWVKLTVLKDLESYLGSGWIVPYKQTIDDVDRVSGLLAAYASGGLFFAQNFTLLIYPTHCIGWEFLDGFFPSVPPEARLRFVMFEPWPQIRRSMDQICYQPKQTSDPASLQDVPANAVIRDRFGMDYGRLVAQSKDPSGSRTRETRSFFLIFPPPAWEEFDLVVDWIQANGPGTIYRYEDPGAWNFFHKTVEKGVIICHTSFVDYWAIPNLAHTLRRSINMFNLSLYPISPLAPDPHLIRLFPAGTAILLTDSLFLHRPWEAARILAWYRLYVPPNKPRGQWKICTRPAIRDWLLKLQARLTYPYGRYFVDCCGELMHIFPRDMAEEWDSDIPKDEAHVACMTPGDKEFDQQLGTRVSSLVELDDQAITRNDVKLCSWFAGWAMTKQEKFRRFFIVTGREEEGKQHRQLKDALRRYNHVSVKSFEGFEKSMDVWDWAVIKKKREEWRVGEKILAELEGK